MAQQRNPKDTDVVITGVAALTPLGYGYEATKQGLRRGETRIGAIKRFDEEQPGIDLFAGELADFDAKEFLGKKGLRNKDRNTLMLLSCIQIDLAEQLATIPEREQLGLTVGTTFGSLASQVAFTADYIRGGFRAVNAMEFPNMVINAPPSQCNIWFDLAASSSTISNGFTAGLDAVVFSADQIQTGRAQRLIAGGSDELSIHLAIGFTRGGLMSSAQQIAPLGAERDGTLLGEGSALVLLESRAQARERGARILAEVAGYASTFDGGMDFRFNTEADGATRAMQQALDAAGLAPDAIDWVAASANGSVEGDQMEATAVKRVFGADRAATLPITAYKSYWGECFAASGALQLAAAIADLEDGVISATCTSGTDALGLNLLREPLKNAQPKTVMINAFGYTGQNTSLILTAPSDA